MNRKNNETEIESNVIMERQKDSLLSGHSPVNKYQLFCLEQSQGGRTEQRMVLAFQAFDELVPLLGVYTKIFKQLRADLFDAVYSDQFTGTASSKPGSGGGEYIQRVPFFSLVKDVYDARDEKAEELADHLETVKERLFEKHRELLKSEDHVSGLLNNVEDLETNVATQEQTLTDRVEEINSLEETLKDEQSRASGVQHQLECDISELQNTLEEAREEIEFLQQYKNGYDNLQDAFSEKTEDEGPRRKTRAVISTKRANLIANIHSAQTIEQQILSVMNATMEEFDRFLEKHKLELSENVLQDDITETEMELQEIDIDQADQQLLLVQERFRQSVQEMNTELELTRNHTTMLKEQLQILEENKPTLPEKRAKNARRLVEKQMSNKTDDPYADRPVREDSVLSAGLDDHDEEDEEKMDPFIPQERVFSKYAAMMYTSNNAGKSFHEFKDALFCPSCGEKTVVCPHKLGGEDKVIILPRDCTHIKIARPRVRINHEMVEELLKPDVIQDVTPVSTADGKGANKRLRDVQSYVPPSSAADSAESPALVHPLHRLWEDYRDRTRLERTVPRRITLERTLSLVDQFYSQLIWQDDYGSPDEGYLSINENLYRFMGSRYMGNEVMYLATHDFLSSLLEYQSENKTIQLLSHILVGNVDSACLRYVLLMSDFVLAADWKEVADFRAFASVVYPFLNEDDLETLQMSYTSFSENKISSQLVIQFIINIILKYREPRFLDMESKLIAFHNKDGGLMTEAEYIELMDNLLPLSNDKLRKKLFWETERHVHMDGIVDHVPILRVSQIASYLSLLQITNVIRESVALKVQEWREQPMSGATDRGQRDYQLVPTEEHLFTMTAVKNLAANFARCARLRERRIQQDDYDW